MKRVMFLCCVFLCIGGICCMMFKGVESSCGGSGQCASLDTYRRFLAEATAFDFCGAGYTSNDVEIAGASYSEKAVEARWFSISEHCALSMTFFSDVKSFEDGFERMDVSGLQDMATEIRFQLKKQQEAVVSRDLKMSIFEYRGNLRRLLYSAQRLFTKGEDSENRLHVVRTLISDNGPFDLDVSMCNWICIDSEFFRRERLFRDLLLLSRHVNVGDSGWYVDRIDLGTHLLGLLEHENTILISAADEWALAGTWSRGFDFKRISITDLIPQIDVPTCASFDVSRLVFVSSGFASGRKEIFRRGKCMPEYVLTTRQGVIVKSNR